jgi:hypothetical protein
MLRRIALTVLEISVTLVVKSKNIRPVEIPKAANRKTIPRAIEFKAIAVIGCFAPSDFVADFFKMCFVIFPITREIRIIPNNAKMRHNSFPTISNSNTACNISMTASIVPVFFKITTASTIFHVYYQNRRLTL